VRWGGELLLLLLLLDLDQFYRRREKCGGETATCPGEEDLT